MKAINAISGEVRTLKRRFIVGMVLSIIMLTSGCASKQALKRSTAALEAGDYRGATENAVAVLKRKSDNNDAQEILRQAFPLAVDELAAEAERKAALDDLQSLDQTVSLYRDLVVLNRDVESLNMVDKSTGNAFTIEVSDFTTHHKEARVRAADGYADHADKLGMAAADRDAFKRAASVATRAMGYVPGHERASLLYDEYREAATWRVAVGAFDNIGNQHTYGNVGSMVVDNMFGQLSDDARFNEFVDMYELAFIPQTTTEVTTSTNTLVNSRPESSDIEVGLDLNKVVVSAAKELLGVKDRPVRTYTSEQMTQQTTTVTRTSGLELLHHAQEDGAHFLLVGEITQVLMEKPAVSKERRSETKRVVIREEEYKDEDGKTKKKKIKGDVTAQVDYYTLKALSTLRFSYKLIDATTGQVWRTNSFTSQDEYVYSWARHAGGDKRGMSGAAKRFTSNEPNLMISDAQRVENVVLKAGHTLAQEMKAHVE